VGTPADTICGGDAWCRERLAVEVDDPETATHRVAELATRGVFAIIAVTSEEHALASDPTADRAMSEAVVRAIAEAANARNVRLAVHERFADRAAEAIDRGARILAHTPYSEPIRETPLLESLVSDRILMITTLWVAGPNFRDPTSATWASRFETRKANTRALARAGGLLCFGTDDFVVAPRDALPWESKR
jgi:imidazolonepropionase-like amidohydrolase